MKFEISQKLKNSNARVGKIKTAHGDIETPAFIVVGTKATVKSLTPEMVSTDVGAQAVLANTYHLYLQPGHELLEKAGGLGKFMNWSGPTFTDSGGFQVFSLGAAFGNKASKLASVLQGEQGEQDEVTSSHEKLAKIDEDGVTFTSVIDGTTHRFTPERSIEIQHAIGADIIFAFDECTSPQAPHQYQREAMERTHRWAERCVKYHKDNVSDVVAGQALLGVVQGGRHEDLRRESARVLGTMDFDGYGIGGSFDKDDIATAVGWVVDELNKVGAEGKPRHLLGIGEPEDLWNAVAAGIDTFDCVAPTRIARNGTLYTKAGKINIMNAQFTADLTPIDPECSCPVCKKYSKAYISHLFRAKEILANTLASIHNLHFIVSLVDGIRESIKDGSFEEKRKAFLSKYL